MEQCEKKGVRGGGGGGGRDEGGKRGWSSVRACKRERGGKGEREGGRERGREEGQEGDREELWKTWQETIIYSRRSKDSGVMSSSRPAAPPMCAMGVQEKGRGSNRHISP